ncbi:MAG: NAD(P)-dependent oxidoreductase, partial [Novosphingobium sp.]
MNRDRLKGKRAFVLGAAGRDNMGQVIARQMRDEGAKVVVAGRGAEELSRIATELGGGFVLCDLTD